MVYTATNTSQNQLTIPVEVTRILNLGKTKKVNIEVSDKKMVVTPEPDIEELCGIFKSKKKYSWKQEKKFIEEGWANGKI